MKKQIQTMREIYAREAAENAVKAANRLAAIKVVSGKYGREKQLRMKAEQNYSALLEVKNRLSMELMVEQAKNGDLLEELRRSYREVYVLIEVGRCWKDLSSSINESRNTWRTTAIIATVGLIVVSAFAGFGG